MWGVSYMLSIAFTEFVFVTRKTWDDGGDLRER
jgi:hypothetical protein